MATQERVYTVEDVWRLEQEPRHPTEKYYLIDGELPGADVLPGFSLPLKRLFTD